MKKLLLFTLVFLTSYSVLPAAEYDNRDALQALTETRAVFDINQGDPRTLALRLKLVKTTYDQLIAAGVTPHFVLTFRGGASQFLTVGDKYVEPEELPDKLRIREQLENLSSRGLPLEQCAIAAELNKIAPEDFIPQVRVVANGYTSLIAYQNRGYAFIPME